LTLARRVHGERSVGLLYGQRALLIGALEPLTYTGTMLSTRAGDRPFERLARTAKIQETVLLGTRAEADEALARVRRLHETVKGALPEAAGAHPAGTAYSAFDPELMLWTLAVIADSGRAMYETLVQPLPDLRATAHGLEMAPLVAFRQPVPAAARGNLAVQNHLIKGTLPPRVRVIFGIRWSRGHERGFRAVAAAHRRAHRALPYRVRRGRNDVFFELVANEERRRGGTATPPFAAHARR
jgi:uncharacterized protein (DUF2236 family)